MVHRGQDWFKCKICGARIRATDYDWLDYHLYESLKGVRRCEECYRRG